MLLKLTGSYPDTSNHFLPKRFLPRQDVNYRLHQLNGLDSQDTQRIGRRVCFLDEVGGTSWQAAQNTSFSEKSNQNNTSNNITWSSARKCTRSRKGERWRNLGTRMTLGKLRLLHPVSKDEINIFQLKPRIINLHLCFCWRLIKCLIVT